MDGDFYSTDRGWTVGTHFELGDPFPKVTALCEEYGGWKKMDHEFNIFAAKISIPGCYRSNIAGESEMTALEIVVDDQNPELPENAKLNNPISLKGEEAKKAFFYCNF